MTVSEFFEVALEAYHNVLRGEKEEGKECEDTRSTKKQRNQSEKLENYFTHGKSNQKLTYAEIWKQKENILALNERKDQKRPESANTQKERSVLRELGENGQNLIKLDQENLDIGRLAYQKMGDQCNMALSQNQKKEEMVPKARKEGNESGIQISTLGKEQMIFEWEEELAKATGGNLKEKAKGDFQKESKGGNEAFERSFEEEEAEIVKKNRRFFGQSEIFFDVGGEMNGKPSRNTVTQGKSIQEEDELVVLIRSHLQRLVQEFIEDLCVEYNQIAPELEKKRETIKILVEKKCNELLDAVISNNEAAWLEKIMITRPTSENQLHFRASVLSFKNLKATHLLNALSPNFAASLLQLCNNIMKTPEMARNIGSLLLYFASLESSSDQL